MTLGTFFSGTCPLAPAFDGSNIWAKLKKKVLRGLYEAFFRGPRQNRLHEMPVFTPDSA
jgi:hypothetical protein